MTGNQINGGINWETSCNNSFAEIACFFFFFFFIKKKKKNHWSESKETVKYIHKSVSRTSPFVSTGKIGTNIIIREHALLISLLYGNSCHFYCMFNCMYMLF